MRKLLIFIFLYLSLSLSGATYYVSPTGNDNNNGTSITTPFLTWQKAFSTASAGDIVYIRGGVYYFTSAAGVSIEGRNGTSNNRIIIQNYPNEVPILDGSNLTINAVRKGISMSSCSYYTLKGLTVRNVKEYGQYNGCPLAAGLNLTSCTNINLERCVVQGCGDGFETSALCQNITFLNCDAYDNADWADDGGFTNGFTITMYPHPAGTSVTLIGCRAWNNSDDGIDAFGSNGYVTVNNCWTWNNGFGGGGNGNGDGIKLGKTSSNKESGIQRTVTNCLSFNNKHIGIDESDDDGAYVDKVFYNNTAYHNGYFAKSQGFLFNNTWHSGTVILRNNISYANAGADAALRSTGITQDHNSWNSGISVSDADFVSLINTGGNDPAQARQSDGSLPVTTFLHLASGSALRQAGIDVGYGTALGAFGALTATTPPAQTPVFVSASVENTTPSILTMTYNLSLSNTAPTTSSFAVLVNSSARTVSSVEVTGTKVQLTLVNGIKYGDVITVSYTKPVTSPLQSSLGAIATSISGQSVSNNLINAAKDASPVSITMTISPNNVYNIINIVLQYSLPLTTLTTTALTPELIRISDLSGKLYVEKLVTTGITNIIIPINLDSGVYNVVISAGGVEMSSKKLIVY